MSALELELAGRHAVVMGLARSGVAAAHLLLRHGARVTATDVQSAEVLGESVRALAQAGVQLELGGHRLESFTRVDLVVVSPGVPWDRPELQAARAAGVPVLGELEFAARFITGPLVAVTGTKGKSTTTAALGAMLRTAGLDAQVGGNIGLPLSGLVAAAPPGVPFVLEASSFQLEQCERLHPRVAVFLNLSPDHLDRHASFEDYAQAKARVFRNQTAGDWAVVNGDDAQVLALARGGAARLVTFHGTPAHEPPAEARACFVDGQAALRLEGRAEVLFERDTVRLPGAHLAADLLAAGVAARLMGAPAEAIGRAVAAFEGLENVLERVATLDGVRYFNDTKATNVDAARHSLLAFAGPLHVIMGGRYKGGDFASLADVLPGRVRTLFAIGEARERLVAALGATVPVVTCASLEAAVRQAHALAMPGDTVLLAPACSSFDMFRDYAARGQAFRDAVAGLQRDAQAGQVKPEHSTAAQAGSGGTR